MSGDPIEGAVAGATQGAGETRPRLFLVLSPLKAGRRRHEIGDLVDLPDDVTDQAIAGLIAGGVIAEADPDTLDAEAVEGPSKPARKRGKAGAAAT